MRKKRLAKQTIVIIAIVCLIPFPNFLPFICSNSTFSQAAKNCENNQSNFIINTKLTNRIKSSDSNSPGSFTLSSDKDEIEFFEYLFLSWSVSEGADNYSLYYSDDTILKINSDSQLIHSNLTLFNYTVRGFEFETVYFVAVAYNETGYTLSNNLEITVTGLGASESMLSAWFWYFPLTLLVIIVLVSSAFIYYGVKQKSKAFSKTQQGSKTQEFDGNSQKKVLIKSSKQIVENKKEKNKLIRKLEGEKEVETQRIMEEIELTSISNEFLDKVEKFPWELEEEKNQFIKEMLALTPKERDEILVYMELNSKKPNIVK